MSGARGLGYALALLTALSGCALEAADDRDGGTSELPSGRDGGEPPERDGAVLLPHDGAIPPDGAVPPDSGAPDGGGDDVDSGVDSGEVSLDRSSVALSSDAVYAGREVTVTITLRDDAGAPVSPDASAVAAFIASGTGTGGFGSAAHVGGGVYEVTLTAHTEGTPITVGATVGGAALTDASMPLEIVQPILHYTPAGPSVELAAVANNLSGVTFNPSSGQYVLIRNNDRFLHDMSPSFALGRAVMLGGTRIGWDLEDIVYLGSPGGVPEYAVVAENGNAAIGLIPDDGATTLGMREWQTLRYASTPPVGNKGGEGIAYDAATGTFWVCTERSPMVVYEFARPSDGADADYRSGLAVRQPFDAEVALAGVVRDISSCLFDARTGRLLILSHESSRLVDLALDGSVRGTMNVDGARQYEGATLDGAGNLMLVSEPDYARAYTYGGRVL